MTASRADIEWAAQALRDGRSMEFIASVLETSQRKARNLIFGLGADRDDRRNPRASIGETVEMASEPQCAEGPADPWTPPDRRKRLLRRRLARHWDMIWYLRQRGMRGRTLRQIYGSAAIIWSVGGGIDTSIDA